MKKLENVKSNRGFTLVELLVALLISGILMATVTSVFLMSQKIYTRAGDISYKQKSITNIETDLQNALSKAISVKILSDPVQDADYNLGFDTNGQCAEIFKGSTEKYVSDQISEITLKVEQTNSGASVGQVRQKTINYELIPKNSMSILSGGIIMNNSENPSFALDSNLNVGEPLIKLQEIKPRYLVIVFATESS
ncbi:MAG: prepilin-type N-terminal cleavage/methylation domain-containing protein [Eubacteriaceae bacterium]|nr:prepilin-type N-terminal cleavage/methylation domain-containing protein [Eubacteriaceae bacterium]